MPDRGLALEAASYLGMIWMPFTGARRLLSVEETGLAVTVKPAAVMVNLT